MFKNLKKKLEQGVAQSKAAVSGLTRGDDSGEKNVSSESLGKPLAESTPQKDASKAPVDQTDGTNLTPTSSQKNWGNSNVPTGQLVDIPLSEGPESSLYETASEMSSVQGDETPKGLRSRTSSISSMTSDSSFFPSISFSHNYYVPSDVESEIEDTSVNLSAVSKEDLYAFVKRFERRAFKYKSKFLELATAYKDMMQEREKLKSTMAQCQDRAFRRMSELREQIQLDHLAKRDLEENYKLLLDEKDEFMKVLQMQVKLLKEGKEIPEELQAKLASKQVRAEASPPSAGESKGNISTNEEIELLKSKIKRQDGLLQKCKDTITSYKEKVSQLSQDKQELLGKIETLKSGSGSSQTDAQTSEQISKMQAQIKEARKVIQQLEADKEVAIAGVKQQVHEEMENKDAELQQVKGQNQKFATENNALKIEVEKLSNEIEDLRKTNQDQLEKAREIMRRLKEDKKQALEQAEIRIKEAEQSMEEEKEKLLMDLKRGKAEAFSVMQQESEKKLSEKMAAAVEERDRIWNEKMAAQEEAHSEVLQSKEREKEMALATLYEEVKQKLKEKDDEVRLALEERELQKMAALTGLDEQKDELLRQIEELNSEKIELINRLSKFQEDTEQHLADLKEKLKMEKDEHAQVIESLKTNSESTLHEERRKWTQKSQEEMELQKQGHSEELQIIQDKLEQSMQETNSETESYYKNQMEEVKTKLEGLLEVTRVQLEDMKNNSAQTEAKLVATEDLLANLKAEFESRKKEHEAQVEELYAAINGKGEENDRLTQLTKDLQSQISSKDKELVDITTRLTQEENSRLTEQVESEKEADSKLNELFVEKESLIQKLQALTDQENEMGSQQKALEETQTELRSQNYILSGELESLREELAMTQNGLRVLQAEKSKVEEVFQQVHSQSEKMKEELASSTERMKQLEELEKEFPNTIKEKELLESKLKEEEAQINQLKAIIRSLESCQSTVEREKAHLEEKLTCLEDIVQDLKISKEELNEKLHERHETLVQRSAEQKQALETHASELATQLDSLKEQAEDLKKSLISKDDEIIALHSVMDDNAGFIKSLETRMDELSQELQVKTQAFEQSEASLAKSLEKFEKLKTEANVKVKGLKEMKDSLTEQLEQKQKECEDIRSASQLENESVIKQYEVKLNAQLADRNSLEQTFKEQFGQKQTKYKEAMSKLKERYEEKLKEKDTQMENCMKELTSQKDLSMGDLTETLENLKKEQLQEQEQRHQMTLEEMKSEWETKYQTLVQGHQNELETISSHSEQHITDLQQQVSSMSNVTQGLAELRGLHSGLELELEKMKSHLAELTDKHKGELENLQTLLAGKDSQIQELKYSLEVNIKEQSRTESLNIQIQSLNEQLHEKDRKLETMAGTISAEQEHLQRLLMQETEKIQELETQKNVLMKQIEELVQKHSEELQEKDTMLIDVNEKLGQLQMEHSAMQEMLKAVNDVAQDKDTCVRSLEEKLATFTTEKDAQIQHLESDLEMKTSIVATVQEELRSLRTQNDEALVDLKQNHSKEIDDLKRHYETQFTQWSASEAELQSRTKSLEAQLSENNEQMQECTQNYESKLEAERSKSERQETSLKQQINILKQQLFDVQSQAEVSSNELQSSLQHKVMETEEKLLAQIQSHHETMETVRQDSEKNLKELKQKYMVKLKELTKQSKATIEELEASLKAEKAAKDEMYSELTRANTRLLQLEENSGTSRDTIVDLERKVGEMSAVLECKDNKLVKLKLDMNENEKNMRLILEEAQSNCQQVRDKLTELELSLKQKEAELVSLQEKLKEKMSLSETQDLTIQDLQKQVSELHEVATQEREKFELEAQEKDRKYSELEVVLDKTYKLLEDSQNCQVELDNKVQSVNTSTAYELERVEKDVQELKSKVSQLMSEKEDLELQLQKTATELEDVLTRQKSVLSETDAQVEQVKQECTAKLIETQETHAAALSELSSTLEAQSSTKVTEYKKKAEAYISQVKKQLQDEKTATVEKFQKQITRLEETITLLTNEIGELNQVKEKLVLEHKDDVQNVKSQLEQEVQLKQSVIEEIKLKEANMQQLEISLKEHIDVLLTEKSSLLEKLATVEKQAADFNVQYTTETEELKSKNNNLLKDLESMKSDKDSDLTLLEARLTETVQKLEEAQRSALEEQTHEHASKVKQLVKEFNQQLGEKERDFENIFREAIEKSDRGERGLQLQYQADLDELRKELQERDERIDELNMEYKSKLQTLENDHKSMVNQLELEIKSARQKHQQEIETLTANFKSENLRNLQSKENSHQEEITALTREWNNERKPGMPDQVLDGHRKEVMEEMVLQNQVALTAFQRGVSGDESLLQQQVIFLTRQMEQLKEKHKLELAEVQSGLEMGLNSLPQPLVAAPAVQQSMNAYDANLSVELQDLELHNMDLQVQVSQLNSELSGYKIKERELLRKLERFERGGKSVNDDDDPPLSMDGSYINHDVSAIFREPTEFEYLKNILYEYMMGRETKTLAKVISTVVRFSEEQTKNVLAKADARLTWLPSKT